jgi:hypothetical protein
MDDAESILRQHVDRRRLSPSTLAFLGAAKASTLTYWPGSEARSPRAAVELFRETSCVASAWRIAERFGGTVAMGFVHREGEDRPMVYAWSVQGDGAILDGGGDHYGRGLGYLGAVLGPHDLDLILGRSNLREGLAAVARAHGRFPSIGQPPQLLPA